MNAIVKLSTYCLYLTYMREPAESNAAELSQTMGCYVVHESTAVEA